MKEAYFEVRDEGIGITACSPELDLESRRFIDQRGRLPAARGAIESAPAVRIALMTTGSGKRVFLRAVTAKGTRPGLTFTHALVIDSQEEIATKDLFCGLPELGFETSASFWKATSGGKKELKEYTTCPWPCDFKELDARLKQWLSDKPAHASLAAAYLEALLDVKQSLSCIFVRGSTVDVLLAAYAAARLLPRRIANRVTFSTYEDLLTTGSIQIVHVATATTKIPKACTESPNQLIDLTASLQQLSSPDTISSGSAGYPEGVIQAWLDPKYEARIDRMLYEVGDEDHRDRLKTWLEFECDRILPDKVAKIAGDAYWHRQVARAVERNIRLLDAIVAGRNGSAASADFLQKAGEPLLVKIRERVIGKCREAIEAEDTALLGLWWDWCPESIRPLVLSAIETLPATKSAEMWLGLAKLLGKHRISTASVLADPTAIEDILLKPVAPSTTELLAEWIFSHTLTPQGHQRLASPTHKETWQRVRSRLERIPTSTATKFFTQFVQDIATPENRARWDELGLYRLGADLTARPDALSTDISTKPFDALLKVANRGEKKELLRQFIGVKEKLASESRLALIGDLLRIPDAISNKQFRDSILEFASDLSVFPSETEARIRLLKSIDALAQESVENVKQKLTKLVAWDRRATLQESSSDACESPVDFVFANIYRTVLEHYRSTSGNAAVILKAWNNNLASLWSNDGQVFWAQLLNWLRRRGHENSVLLVQEVVSVVIDDPTLAPLTDAWFEKLLPDAKRKAHVIMQEMVQERLHCYYPYRLIQSGPLSRLGMFERIKDIFREKRDSDAP